VFFIFCESFCFKKKKKEKKKEVEKFDKWSLTTPKRLKEDGTKHDFDHIDLFS
jgi:hypothetical protein